VAKLGASILSADLAHLADQVKLVEADADLIHIDVMDAHFVPPLTIGPPVVASLRPHTTLPLHAHLQVEMPEGLFDDLAGAGADAVAFHLEAVADAAPVIRKARGAGMRVGIALAPETPVEEVFPYLEELDDVIVLAVHPGWAGQPFRPGALPRLRAVREEIERRALPVELQVDGGVDASTARGCVEAGATVLVAATAIFGAEDPTAAARDLRRVAEAS
jgi:ribulose-phosphate 3-epimerase